MVKKRFPLNTRSVSLACVGGVLVGILAYLSVHYSKRWVRREIARAHRTFQPFQPTPSYPYAPAQEGNFNDDDPTL